jgi:hypothetical protein
MYSSFLPIALLSSGISSYPLSAVNFPFVLHIRSFSRLYFVSPIVLVISPYKSKFKFLLSFPTQEIYLKEIWFECMPFILSGCFLAAGHKILRQSVKNVPLIIELPKNSSCIIKRKPVMNLISLNWRVYRKPENQMRLAAIFFSRVCYVLRTPLLLKTLLHSTFLQENLIVNSTVTSFSDEQNALSSYSSVVFELRTINISIGFDVFRNMKNLGFVLNFPKSIHSKSII